MGEIQENENQPFLSVKDIEVVYTQEKKIVHAVNGVSFDMQKGESLGLVGETGAGKTTIARSILRILPDPPAIFKGGSIELNGVNLMDLSEEEMLKVRGKQIAMIFQDPMTALNPLMTVGDQILEVLTIHNKDKNTKELMDRAADMLEMVNIPRERYGEYPHQFSGGMKQRVVIAMALACDPDLLLADEPTTALDVTIQAQVLDLIRDLREKYNTSMILITHDLGIVAETCDKVAVIYAGELVEYGTIEAVFNHPTHPYTVGLFNSLPDIHKKTARLEPIPGMPPDPTDLPTGCAFSPRCPYADEECRTVHPEFKEAAPGHLVRCCKRDREV